MPGLSYIDQFVCTRSRYRHMLIGSWDCNAASNPADLQGDLKSLGSVVRTSAGLFTYTFSQKPGKILEALAVFRGNIGTAGDNVAVGVLDAVAGTITVRTKDAANAQKDIPATQVRVVLFVWVSKMKNLVND